MKRASSYHFLGFWLFKDGSTEGNFRFFCYQIPLRLRYFRVLHYSKFRYKLNLNEFHKILDMILFESNKNNFYFK